MASTRKPSTHATGRLLIVTQGVMANLDATDEEREEFVNHLADTYEERTRQSLLTWRANRSTQADLTTAQEIDKSRRGSV